MINPHYIELIPVNFDKIIYWTHAQLEYLEENYKDSQEAGKTFYIRFYRTPEGMPTWMCYEHVAMMNEFDMEYVDPYSRKDFVKF